MEIYTGVYMYMKIVKARQDGEIGAGDNSRAG